MAARRFNPIHAYFMIPGVIGMILYAITAILTATSVVRERERGTIEQLIVTPIRPWELVVGKILPFVIMGLLEATEVIMDEAEYCHRVGMMRSGKLLAMDTPLGPKERLVLGGVYELYAPALLAGLAALAFSFSRDKKKISAKPDVWGREASPHIRFASSFNNC